MEHDPFTLRVALSQPGGARGVLYLDDGETYGHLQGNFVWREFIAESGEKTVTISSRDFASKNLKCSIDGVELATYDKDNVFANGLDSVQVERIAVLGLGNRPSKVRFGSINLEFTFEDGVSAGGRNEGLASKLTIECLGVLIANDWTVVLEF